MKKMLIAVAALGLVPAAAVADVSKEDLKKLAAAGISDEVILTYLRTHGPMLPLTADDLVELKQAGVSDRILTEVAGRPAAPPPAAPAPRTELVERTVYVTSPAPCVVEPAPRIVYYDSGIFWTWYTPWPVRYYCPPRALVTPTIRIHTGHVHHCPPPPSPPRSYSSIRVASRSRW